MTANNVGAGLPAEKLSRLRNARGALNEAQLEIERCTRCGMDMRGDQALCDALCERVDAMLREFGQGRQSR